MNPYDRDILPEVVDEDHQRCLLLLSGDTERAFGDEMTLGHPEEASPFLVSPGNDDT
jgi:hypothetical protein